MPKNKKNRTDLFSNRIGGIYWTRTSDLFHVKETR